MQWVWYEKLNSLVFKDCLETLLPHIYISIYSYFSFASGNVFDIV